MIRKTLYLTAIALVMACTPFVTRPSTQERVDIKVNNVDGRITVDGEPFIFSWTSAYVDACQLETPSGKGGVSLSGIDGPVGPDHVWYPQKGAEVKLKLTCTRGKNRASDIVTIARK